MRVLSLFSGIGAHDLGLEWAGMQIVGQVEIDEYCQEKLKKNFPEIPKWRDIRRLTANDILRTCGKIDLITGGFPCQDISVAGRGKGLAGEKSGLWWEMWRLIRDLQPDWLLVENSVALRVRGFDTVQDALEALSYSCWPVVVGAHSIGAPHKRNRLWLVGHSNGKGSQRQSRKGKKFAAADWRNPGFWQKAGGLADASIVEIRKQSGRQCKTCGQETLFSFPAGEGLHQHDWEEPRIIEPGMGGPASRTARGLALKALGNANPPQLVMLIGRAIMQAQKLTNSK